MPRAGAAPRTSSTSRVNPASRLQPYAACLACRRNKKRCSGTFPCSLCIHKGQASSCQPAKRNIRESRTWTLRSRSPSDGPADPIRPTPREPSSPEAPHRTHPRMLRNRQGERVYIGKAASLSFLQLLRDIFSQQIGPSQFSNDSHREDMLETETPHDIAVLEDSFSLDQKVAFMETYFIATSGFIHVISHSEAMQILNETTPSSETRAALSDVMIAIGAQSCKANPTAMQAERFFFARGQRKAFTSMLVNPSLELVRLFLLMSFYMLGACRRNAAFMYLGIASRAAAALGLHNAEYLAATDVSKSRIWMSVCVLDLLVSSILGRPSATATLRPDVEGNATGSISYGRLNASYRLSLILDDIIARLYNEKSAPADVAEYFLRELNKWKSDLPESLLSPPSMTDESSLAQEHIIGSLHVACSYHFAVIVVTRPFLVSVLSLRLARLAQDFPDDQIPQDDPAHSKLASACTDSAMYMMQTCIEVHRSQLLLGNMCILKAFVFAAALVLGFSMFSQRQVDPGLEEAFNGAIEILRILSYQSAQAAHYFEILTTLANAITEQRQRLTSQRRGSQYVSKLFTLDNNNPSRATPRDQETALLPQRAMSPVSAHANNVSLLAQGDYSFNIMPEMESLFSGWEGMDLPLWDSFPFLTEPDPIQDRPGESSGL